MYYVHLTLYLYIFSTVLYCAVPQCLSIFENAVEYNASQEASSETAKRLVVRSRQLVQYARWLCLEALPVLADKDRADKDRLGE
jgi:hypothetical protein